MKSIKNVKGPHFGPTSRRPNSCFNCFWKEWRALGWQFALPVFDWFMSGCEFGVESHASHRAGRRREVAWKIRPSLQATGPLFCTGPQEAERYCRFKTGGGEALGPPAAVLKLLCDAQRSCCGDEPGF